MSTLKCTIIVIILTAYQVFQCAYAQPTLSKEVVKCINDLAAYVNVPTPFTPGLTEDEFADLLINSAKDGITHDKYLNENEDHYVGQTTLSRLMLAKSAIANFKRPDFNVDENQELYQANKEKDIIANYFERLILELSAVGVQPPLKFCQEHNSLSQNIIDKLSVSIIQSNCKDHLKDFPRDKVDALSYGYLKTTVSELKHLKYGVLYMKHLIMEVIFNYGPHFMLRHRYWLKLDEPEEYCKKKTASTASSSSGN